jgi:hypothetical protein
MSMLPRLMPKAHSQVGLRRTDECAELLLILALHILKRDNGRSLLVDHRAKAGLALHDDIRNTHLPAKRGEEDNKLNRVNVVRNHDERGLLRFDKGNTVVQAVLDEKRLLVL